MGIEQITKNADALVAMAFSLGLGLIILGKFQSSSIVSNTSTAYTAIGNFITGLDDYADWIGIIVLVGVGVYLLASFRKR